MTGFAEITLPAVQPGSSIMPGKVNPVMAECLSMVCFRVIGNDTTIAWAASAGQLELNVMMPVIAHTALESPHDPDQHEPRLRRVLRDRHRGQPRARPRPDGALLGALDAAGAVPRLRPGRGDLQAGGPRAAARSARSSSSAASSRPRSWTSCSPRTS